MATTLRDTLKGILGSAWHVAHDAFFTALAPAADGTVEANKFIAADANKDVTGIRNLTLTGDLVMDDLSLTGNLIVDGAEGTGTATPGLITLTTPELTVVSGDQLGRIDFQAPLEASGTDAILVSASIVAVASNTFDTTHNSTDLVFMVGESETAAEYLRLSSLGVLTHKGSFAQGANATDRATIKGIYMNPAVVSVAVPTIANDAAENVDRVDVDVSTAFAIQPAVGDAVIAIPMAALPTDCVLLGAYVSATDHIIVSFGSIEGGGGVTGASVNFNFLIVDLT